MALHSTPLFADTPLDLVLKEQDRLVAMIDRVAPAVVAVYDVGQHGGGSGILIDGEGFGITNQHVVAGFLDTRRGLGGLGDGELYPLEVLGIDPIGDVAMFRLTGRDAFPHATLGDSDRVRVGDVAIAIGNPFNISEDHTPTISRGIVTGVNRYQWGTKGLLIYSDCIQTDAPINPGNSGGPLFNALGEVIGINGRISVNTRGRLNVGFGYAITSNQVRRFIPALRAGRLATHGTLQATVEEGPDGLVFAQVRPERAAERAGVQTGDRLIAIDGLPINSPNRFASLTGTYPGDWQVLLEIERGGKPHFLTADLDPVLPKMNQPFVENPWLGAREVWRVLHHHQAARMVGDHERSAARLHWQILREAQVVPGDPVMVECYDNLLTPDGTMQVQPIGASRTARRTITVNSGNIVQRHVGSDEEFALTIDQQMLWAALHLVHHTLLQPLDTLDLWPIKPAGGNMLYGKGDQAPDPPSQASADDGPPGASGAAWSRRYGLVPQPVEMLDWPIDESAMAQLAFSTDTHDLLRMALRDIPSGTRVTVELFDYQDIFGIRRPTRMTTSGPNFRYVDTLEDWEETP